jgi:hypothetical protein
VFSQACGLPHHPRLFDSLRSNLNPAGIWPRNLRMLASALSIVRSRATSNRRARDTVISISSPGLSLSVSTRSRGKRTAKLFSPLDNPHIEFLLVLHMHII